MKKLLLSGVLCVLTFSLFSQQLVRCNTMQNDSVLRAQPGAESMQDFENWLQAKIVQYKTSAAYLSGQRSIITIPIVFHIIHNGDAEGVNENLSQAQINSQIAVLNEDFRKTFGTAGYNTNAVGADCEIEFCPAVIDPTGAVLSQPGIDRRNLGQTSWAQADINATVKPQTIWDPERYCNVWTVQFGGTSTSLLGYAQFPSTSGLQGINANGGNANTDGVVIRYNATGRVGTLDNTYNKGRTLTHEIGHWLGLRHIWGDQSCGNDYCGDTPTSTAANYGCPTNKNTCNEGNPNLPDMVENYMDYTDDACMNLFTQNQKDRILTVMNASPRRLLLQSSNVCTIPFTFSFTGKVVDAVSNVGIADAKVLIDGATDYSPTTDANGNFTIANLQQGNYTIYAGKWGYVTNTVATQTITPSTPLVTVALQQGYYDDFTFDFTWTESGAATSGKWERGVPSGTSFTTGGNTIQSNPAADVTGDYTNKAYVTGNDGGSAGDDDVDGGSTTLTSPAMDLSTYTNPVVRFYRWFYNGGGTGTPDDSLIVSLTSGGQTVTIDKIAQGMNSNQWVYKSYRVKDFITNPGANVTIKFRTFDSTVGHLVEAGVDLFRVLDSTATVGQNPIANFASNNTTICSGSQILFNDLSSNNPTAWQWTFVGGSPGVATTASPVITYNTPGIYPVTLTVNNGGPSNTVTQTSYITVSPVVAQFTQNKTGICFGQEVTFTSQTSCNPTAIKWVFTGGSPTISTSANPTVTYTTPGFYDVTLIASNQYGADTLVQNLAIQVFAPISLTTTSTPDTNASNVGTATVNVSAGGTPPYTYLWTDANQQTAATATGLSPGAYNVSVTDGNGCSSITSILVLFIDNTVGVNLINTDNVFNLYPNPTSGKLNVELQTLHPKSEVEIRTLVGTLINVYPLTSKQTTLDVANLANGVYLFTVKSESKVQTSRFIKQ